ncbi:hypothetical protein H4R35_006505 [Dimargaris xerosporica]|nr:hypothetical protein H4R35_006505 [Dimargaris xerosporica]
MSDSNGDLQQLVNGLQEELAQFRAEFEQFRQGVGGSYHTPTFTHSAETDYPDDLPAKFQSVVSKDQCKYRLEQGQVVDLAAAVPKRLGKWFTVAKLEPHWKDRMASHSIQMDAVLEQSTKRQRAVCDGLLALCDAFEKFEQGQVTAEDYKDKLLHLFVLNLHFAAKLTDERRTNALKGANIPNGWHHRFHNIADHNNNELFEFASFDVLQQLDDHQYKRHLAMEERKLKQANKSKNDHGQWNPGKKKPN